MNDKKEETDSAQPDFWSQRYASGKTPWQLDRVPERLGTFIQSLLPASRVLIPGCGLDLRSMDAFRKAGHDVIAIDFSAVAVARVKTALPDLGHKIILGNFFSYNFGEAAFDVIYERTFLCSLPPRLWRDYSTRMAQLLRPRGLLAGFFFYGEESDPPPFPLNKSSAADIFGSRFEMTKTEPVADSLSIFAGREKWQEWQLRS